MHCAGFLGSIFDSKQLFLSTCLAGFSVKLVTILKCVTCLLLSFCMEHAPQTKALCHPVLAAKFNVFSIKFTFLISLMCSIASYSRVLEDGLETLEDSLYVTCSSCFYTCLSSDKNTFAELTHRMSEWVLFLRRG